MFILWNKNGMIAILITVLMLYLIHLFGHQILWRVVYKLDEIIDDGSPAIVKDIIGGDPYMTIKMKCYYKDNQIYGDNWKRIIEATECHDHLFNKCFRNRTVVGRHETHVLTFMRYENIKRCVCTDITGWCNSECSNLPSIRCCLDRGKLSVLCRG